MQVKPEIERFAKIRVVGVGGAGGNVINSMIDSNQIRGVEFIAINTDAQDLSINKAVIKIPIGQELTQGLGAGSNPEIGKKAAEESLDIIKSNLEGANMVFITAGLGGGTGTGASPTVARIAKESGALTIGVVTKPFNFEGIQRMRAADRGIMELRKEVDALITIPNQKLLEVADEDMSIIEAFRLSDSVLNQGVQGISDLIVMPGLINVDFADVKAIMKDAGTALMGIGIGTGENRAEVAAQAAISSPLLEQSVVGAKGILFNISGGPDLTMREVDRAANIIRGIAGEEADIIFGTSIDDELTGQLKITVIATGFEVPEEDDSMAGYVEKHYGQLPKKEKPEIPFQQNIPRAPQTETPPEEKETGRCGR
ncbi:MAG: Cell division protein FtsZ [candidate division WWE3 bacterium GW2011_GWB1_42_41]|nr:MAG: Cell division protein FtsZ [candidate division WWE3 bacterium GW2011_GWB1_42_41]